MAVKQLCVYLVIVVITVIIIVVKFSCLLTLVEPMCLFYVNLVSCFFDDGGVTDGKFCKKITASLPWITSLKSQHKDCEVLFF